VAVKLRALTMISNRRMRKVGLKWHSLIRVTSIMRGF